MAIWYSRFAPRFDCRPRHVRVGSGSNHASVTDRADSAQHCRAAVRFVDAIHFGAITRKSGASRDSAGQGDATHRYPDHHHHEPQEKSGADNSAARPGKAVWCAKLDRATDRPFATVAIRQ